MFNPDHEVLEKGGEKISFLLSISLAVKSFTPFYPYVIN